MAYAAFTKDVLRDYERDRGLAERKIDERRGELEAREPRLREIDGELAAAALKAAGLILSGKQGGAAEALKERNAALLAEKRAILARLRVKDGWEDALYKCAKCRDTGFDGDARCACFRRRLIDKFAAAGNLGSAPERENFDTFDLSYYGDEPDPKAGVSPKAAIQKIWQVCLGFCKYFDERFENLLFYGDTGLGKTFLCNSIAKEILERGKAVVYVTAPQLCKAYEDLRFNRAGDSAAMLTELAAEADLLIIDDLGTEVPTVVTNSELFALLNERLLARRPCVISTNLTLNALQEMYSERLTSRLIGNYSLLRFLGNDIRVKKKYGG